MIYRSTDYGSTWMDLNSDLSITQFTPGVSAFPGSAYRLLWGTQDNGTLEYDGSPAWPEVLGGDGGFTAVNFQAPTTAFAEQEWLTGYGNNGRSGLGELGDQRVRGGHPAGAPPRDAMSA